MQISKSNYLNKSSSFHHIDFLEITKKGWIYNLQPKKTKKLPMINELHLSYLTSQIKQQNKDQNREKALFLQVFTT